MTTQQPQPSRGIVKQVLSGDSVIIRALVGAPPPEKQISFTGITAPKLARRVVNPAEEKESRDEPCAWEAREFLRKKLIGETVWFNFEKKQNREYGCVYLGPDFNTAENITESLVAEGLASVRKDANRNNPDIARLFELEEAAKAAGKGKWAQSANEKVRNIKWSIENPSAFVEKCGGKPMKAIIEHVRDGSTVRAFLLPDFYHITLMMAGIRCPGFKLDESGKPDMKTKVPFAEEARYFVEVRLLQRDVEIVLESVNNTNFIGTIIHPKGNIAALLLREGFARCVDWSMVFMKSGADKLRAAERVAKEKRLRIWKDYKSQQPQVTGKEREFTGTVIEVVGAEALNIRLQTGQIKKVFLASIRPPKEPNRVADEDGKLPARPKGFRPLYDIPVMFEAREFLRKRLVGKKAHVTVDYIQPAKDNYPEKICCTVTAGGTNVAEQMVSKGLATVIRYRQDDEQRSSKYDDLLAAEAKALKAGKGIHAKNPQTTHKVKEVTGDMANKFLPSFKRASRVEAIVEFVASGSRLRMFVPKESCLITFLLAGINCPRVARPAANGAPAIEGEEFGEEALQYTREKCLQRDVTIQVESLDKAGSFIGWLFLDNNTNLSVALVEQGIAGVHPSERSEYSRQLKQAEDNAKAKRLKRWAKWTEPQPQEQDTNKEEQGDQVKSDKPVERKPNYEQVVVAEITPEAHIYVQSVEQGPKLEALNTKLRQELQANPPTAGAYSPKKNEMCAARFSEDDQWYRAKVEKLQGSNVHLVYVDYGNREVLPAAKCAPLPAPYAADKPYAVEYALACVQLPSDPEYRATALRYLREDCTQVPHVLLNVEYRPATGPAAVTLVNPQTNEDIVKDLIVDGLLLVENRRERRLAKLVSEYMTAQENAKRNHLNVWEYGDITEDDAKEFGIGR